MNLQNMFKEIACKRNAASKRRAEAALRPGLQQPVDSPTAGSPTAAEDHQPQKPRAAQSTGPGGPAPPGDVWRGLLGDRLEVHTLLP